MVFQSKISTKIAHPTGCARKGTEFPRDNSPGSGGGDFIHAEGAHLRLSQGLPFVLGVNGGQILVHVLEEFDVQLQQDNFPMILYVEPGPNVSTLDSGISFTLFVRGRLFLVQVLRVLRQPDSGRAVTINLISPSLGAVGPESESPHASPCTGFNPLPSPKAPDHPLRTPDSTAEAHRADSASLSSETADRSSAEAPPSLQMPIPTRAVGPELLSPDYGWPKTTSPLPLALENTRHDSSPKISNATLQAKNVANKFICPLRTPDTPSRIRSDSLVAQHGSLLSGSIFNQQAQEEHEIKCAQHNVWPSAILASSSLGGEAVQKVGLPNSLPEECINFEARLARIMGPAFPQLAAAHGRYTSLKPELDPKISVANDYSLGLCESPFPAPIGTGRPHGPMALPPIGQPFLHPQNHVHPVPLGAGTFCPVASPFSRGVSSIKQDFSSFTSIKEAAHLPVMDTLKDIDPIIGPASTAFAQHLQPVAPISLRPFGTPSPFLLEVEPEDKESLSSPPRCNVEN